MQHRKAKFALIDLSHVIDNGLVTYKGLPAPVICDYLSREDSKKYYEEGTSFQIGKIEMVTNTGTYIDCPFHRYSNGKDIAGILLEDVAELPLTVVTVPYKHELSIGAGYFKELDIKGHAVLVNTGWAGHWNTGQYYENHPFLTKDAAVHLVNCGVKIVGIDSHNIDDTRTNSRPVHSTLLGAGILIVEHLCNLQVLPKTGGFFSAVPPKFKGAGTFPVRAFAKVPV
ncbi:MAG TPA: cyclase family protein [Chitinophagaceae bacterium]|jgi:kynurenine formamidase|nr:cyclase family protein [Chitinophagaceae bacterium]